MQVVFTSVALLQYGNYYGDKCVNSYFLWYDVRLTRNVIEEFHRCVRMKDPEFLDRLIKLEDELVRTLLIGNLSELL